MPVIVEVFNRFEDLVFWDGGLAMSVGNDLREAESWRGMMWRRRNMRRGGRGDGIDARERGGRGGFRH